MLNTTNIQSISLVLLSFIISGCGGSGGSGESSSPDAVNEVATESASESLEALSQPAAEVVLEMDSLVAAEDFTFTSKKQIELLLALKDAQQQRAYVSLYSDYRRLDSGRYYPDSTSRIIGGALQNGMFEQSFIGLNDQQKYLIDVWFYDGREPLQKELSVNNYRLIW